MVNPSTVHRRAATAARISVLALALLAPCTPAAAADAPTVQATKQRVIAALGGDSRLTRFRSVRAQGSMVGVSGFPGTFDLIAKAPDRRRLTWDIGYLKQTTAVDASTAWERSAAAREIVGDELTRARRDARFNALYELLRSEAPATIEAGECASGVPVLLLHFTPAALPTETFGIDAATYLPRCEIRQENYEEGTIEIRTHYADYRVVQGLSLPHSIRQIRPEGALELRVERYAVNPELADEEFRNPARQSWSDPIAIELATLPEHVYKEPEGNYTLGAERFWGMYFYASESLSLDLVVKERHGRYLDPLRARVEMYADRQLLGSQEWSRAALLTLRRYPVARFTPQGEIYGFRHNFSVARTQRLDTLVYVFEARAADGQTYRQQLQIPVTTYRPRTALIFPIKGKFLVTTGHEHYEVEHKYERSQQFSIDVVALGVNFEFAANDGATAEDYVGYGRREILAPAAGRVVFARNDIPDGAVKADFLKMKDAITAPAGNVVIIDHGNQEFSIFCHMHFGSVRVRTGDSVQRGQTIGLLGASGSPGLPHLHYQLQNGPNVFGNDGLPLVFTNIERVAWLGRRSRDDQPATVDQPRSGVFMQAN